MLISFEGIDGCGKTTQLNLVEKGLGIIKPAQKVFKYKEDLDPIAPGWDAHTQLLYVIATRINTYLPMQHMFDEVLSKKHIVLMDRFVDSTCAYQGCSGGIEQRTIMSKHNSVFNRWDFMPDLTFLFDLDPQVALRRKGTENERLKAILPSVCKGYRRLAKLNEGRIKVIDAMQTQSGIQQEVMGHIILAMKKRGM